MALRTVRKKPVRNDMPSREELERQIAAASDALVAAMREKADVGTSPALDHRIRKLRRDIHNLKMDLKNEIYRQTHESTRDRDARLANQSQS